MEKRWGRGAPFFGLGGDLVSPGGSSGRLSLVNRHWSVGEETEPELRRRGLGRERHPQRRQAGIGFSRRPRRLGSARRCAWEVSLHSAFLGLSVLPPPAVLTAAALSSLGRCPAQERRAVGFVSPALPGWLAGQRDGHSVTRSPTSLWALCGFLGCGIGV